MYYLCSDNQDEIANADVFIIHCGQSYEVCSNKMRAVPHPLPALAVEAVVHVRGHEESLAQVAVGERVQLPRDVDGASHGGHGAAEAQQPAAEERKDGDTTLWLG